MHEVGVAHEILQIVKDTAEKNKAEFVKKIGIRVGTLSGVEASSLKFALEALKEETIAQNAEIDIAVVNAVGICGDCGKSSSPDTFFSICVHCGSPALDIKEGEEFAVSYIEIDDGENS